MKIIINLGQTLQNRSVIYIFVLIILREELIREVDVILLAQIIELGPAR